MTTFECMGEYSWGISVGIAAGLAAVCWWIYYAHLRDAPLSHRWLLPTLRGLAVALCVLMLAGPTLRHRSWNGSPNRVTVLLDATQSMRWNDRQSADADPARSRFERAARLLLAENGQFLKTLSQRSEVAVSRFAGTRTVPLWASSLAQSHPLPDDASPWLPQQWLSPTALGDLLTGIEPEREAVDQDGAANKSDDATASDNVASVDAVVLLTDGRTNAGSSPLEAVRQMAAQKRRLFVVGYGQTEEPNDLAITSIQCPERLLKTDLLRGVVVWKEQMPAGQLLELCIRAGDKVVWEQTVICQRRQQRSTEFAIPVRDLPMPAAQSPGGFEINEQSVTLRATIEAVAAAKDPPATSDVTLRPTETNADNNERPFHVRIATRQYRILILDGRARWESRYLRNALQRDPNWKVDAFILDPVAGRRPFSDSGEQSPLPETFEDLLRYDLLVMGELSIDTLPTAWLENLSRYVGDSGGGLLVIDGSHGSLRDAAWHELHRLLPVQWLSAQGQLPHPTSLQLTPAGEALEALRLESDSTANPHQLWRDLPGISFAAKVRANPGSETLLALDDDAASPVMVTQRFGAGRVVYLATDETWRWRYGVADLYHQRWWNQLARWAMRMPFAVQNEFLQLTTDRAQYETADPILVTARLRDQQGKGVVSGDVQVVCRRVEGSSQIVQTVSMRPDETIAGLYRATVTGLPAGSYELSVTAAGIPDRSLALACPVAVVAKDNPELQELACNEPLLRELAETTGGAYLHEEAGEQLLDLLLPLSHAETAETQTALAESYFWFVPVVLLLSVEWWLRKRAGLL
jgi:uncharacterized membrane protein